MRRFNQQGFAMPVIILLISLMAVTAYSVLSQAGTSVGQSYNNAYKNLSREAANAGLNYAQEQFDNTICDSYNGTTEQTLALTSNYRTSFKTEVLESSSDGLSKTIKSTGYLYSPASATQPKKSVIKKTIIYNSYTDKCKNPNYYAPLLWLDASDSNSLIKPGAAVERVTATTKYGNASDTTRDSLEERQDNGSQTNDSWSSEYLELHSCNPAEYSNSVCTSQSTKRQNVGLIFTGVKIPKNSDVLNANLILNCSNGSTAGPVTTSVSGLYKNANEANPELFAKNNSNQLKNALRTSTHSDKSTNRCSPDGQIKIDVTGVVQEIINNNDWNPNDSNDSRLGLILNYVNGNGSRQIYKNGNTLNVTFASSAAKASANDPIGYWLDKSGNLNNAESVYGTSPVLEANQIGGKNTVKFNNGAMVSSLLNELSARQELTTFVVLKPNFGASADNGRIVTGLNKNAAEDDTIGQSILPLLRNGDKNGFASQYSGSASAYRTGFECESCDNTASIATSSFNKYSGNNILATLYLNNQKITSQNNIKPAGNPYTFSIDQLYVGGSRSGSLPGTGKDYFNGNYAEIIVYDKALSCRQILSIQNYLREKWSISGNNYQDTCNEQINRLN